MTAEAKAQCNVSQKHNNDAIDILRIICALFVVSMHSNTLNDISTDASFILNQIIARFAVPFFLCVGGYFFFKKITRENAFGITKKYVVRLGIIYLIWSALYFVFDLACSQDRISYLKEFIPDLLFRGSHFHFWYFPALIIAAIICGAVVKLGLEKIFVPVCAVLYLLDSVTVTYAVYFSKCEAVKALIGFSEFTAVERIFFRAVPLFMLGYCLNGYLKKNSGRKKRSRILSAVSALCLAAEIITTYIVNKPDTYATPVFMPLFVMAVTAVCIENPLYLKSSTKLNLRGMSLFIYCIHPFFIFMLQLVWRKLFAGEMPTVLLFAVTSVMSVVIFEILSLKPLKKHFGLILK